MLKSVYVFESDGQFKIGVSKNVNARLKSIKTGNPNIHIVYEGDAVANAYTIESMLHAHFSNYRVNGEWFSLPPKVDIVETVKRFVDEYGVFEESAQTETDKFSKLMERLFESTKREIAVAEDEISKIKVENEVLMERLRSCGWSDFDIKKLVDDAEQSVLAQYA